MTDELRSFDDAVNFIRSLNKDIITAEYIENVIMPKTGFGLVPEFLPPSLQVQCGKGVWTQQMPNQFAPYLRHLIDREVSSYLEVGSAHGGSFVLTCEILSKFRPVHAEIISMTGKSKFLRRYEENYGANFAFHTLDSHSPEALGIFIDRNWDHVFLDGDHSCDGMTMDFIFASRAARMAALHDVRNDMCRPGMEAWKSITARYNPDQIFEFTNQYSEEWTGKRSPGMGIGLIEFKR